METRLLIIEVIAFFLAGGFGLIGWGMLLKERNLSFVGYLLRNLGLAFFGTYVLYYWILQPLIG